MSYVKVVMFDHGRGEIFIDGVEVKGVSGIDFSACVDGLNKVTLTMIANQFEIEGVADVTLIGDSERKYAMRGVE